MIYRKCLSKMLAEIRKMNTISTFSSVSTICKEHRVNHLTRLTNALMENPGFYEEPALSMSVHEAS